jgi:hypothetical protein
MSFSGWSIWFPPVGYENEQFRLSFHILYTCESTHQGLPSVTPCKSLTYENVALSATKSTISAIGKSRNLPHLVIQPARVHSNGKRLYVAVPQQLTRNERQTNATCKIFHFTKASR